MLLPKISFKPQLPTMSNNIVYFGDGKQFENPDFIQIINDHSEAIDISIACSNHTEKRRLKNEIASSIYDSFVDKHEGVFINPKVSQSPLSKTQAVDEIIRGIVTTLIQSRRYLKKRLGEKVATTEKDLIKYANRVRAEFLPYPHIYKEVLEIMKACQSQQDIKGAILRIGTLFQGKKKSLVSGFNHLLPDGYLIATINGKVYYRTPEDPILLSVFKTIQNEQKQDVESGKEASSNEGMNNIQKRKEGETKEALCQSIGRKKSKDILIYMEQIRAEFLEKPGIHKEVLEAMRVCLTQQNIKGAILRIAKLFRGKKKSLVLGFNKLLPDGYEIAPINGIVYYRTPEEPFLTPVLNTENEQKQDKRSSGKEDSSCEDINTIQTQDNELTTSAEETVESSPKDSNMYKEIGKKRQSVEDHTDINSDNAIQKRSRELSSSNSKIQDSKSGMEVSSFESKKEGKKKVVLCQSINGTKSVEDTVESFSPKISNMLKEVGQKRQNTDVKKVEYRTESNSDDATEKETRAEAQQNDTESSSNPTKQDVKSGKEASRNEGVNTIKKMGKEDTKEVLSQSIDGMKSVEDAIEYSSPKISKMHKEIGKKRQSTDRDKVKDHIEGNSHVFTRKRTRVEAQQNDKKSWFRSFVELYKDYLSLQTVNGTLSQTFNEAELQLYNTAKELKSKEKELDDAKSELANKCKEFKVKEMKFEKVLKERIGKETQAIVMANKKSEDASKYVISKKNEEIERKEKVILSKDSTIRVQKEEIERLQQELLTAKSLKKDLLSELECPLCLEPFEDPCIVPECCHRFCTSCIESSIKECGKECPLCRKRVTSKRALRKDGFIETITNIMFGKNEGKEGEDNS
ncbi:hypothetical protein CTEN210_06699 [Chaetoceros tenuissimus]|uniref:RING-type E3 ubiquitin transferase n=1 Tax=Chaetoceros tenuissimus TaxID=426638 RepID=A0AAD3H4Z5_9STRA|nr:hypothetical protein CTEN210_06699 [Chaetoceros tenuissimus]